MPRPFLSMVTLRKEDHPVNINDCNEGLDLPLAPGLLSTQRKTRQDYHIIASIKWSEAVEVRWINLLHLLGRYTALSRHAPSVQLLLGSYYGCSAHIYSRFANLDGTDAQQLQPRESSKLHQSSFSQPKVIFSHVSHFPAMIVSCWRSRPSCAS